MHVWAVVLLRSLATLVVVLTFAWGGMALVYQLAGIGKLVGVVLWSAAGVAALVLLWRANSAGGLGLAVAAMVLFWSWWRGIAPSDTRDWADDVARHVESSVDGDIVTLRNVRNFDWRTETDYDVRWETRRYDLGLLQSVDVICSYWMGPAIAHTLVSFGFGDGQFVTFSIEIRKERGESFSAIGGFFKQFEATLIAADERDILKTRTNARGEDVYMYRITNMSRDDMRALFMGYLERGRELLAAPRWYHTLTGNCTTIVYAIAHVVVKALPLDYRLLASGYLPDYLYDNHALTPGFDLETLRARGRITDRARAADEDPDFSRRIRDGIPGAS